MTEANVHIGSWVAWGGDGNDGFYIKEKGLKGLFSGVGIRSSSVPYPQAHGDFDVPVFRSSRFVTITGPCIADSAEKLDWYSNQFTGLLADGQSGRVIFDVPGGARWGDARLFDVPDFEPVLWGKRADYMLQLKFANPRLFGETHTFSPATSITAHHYGNFPAAPVLTVTGASPSGYTITGPAGRLFIVTLALVAGTPHVIDMASGHLRVGGAIVYGGISRGDTWAIPGGASVDMSVSGGSATLSASVLDTFI